MRILLNDVIQNSDVPNALKTPALSDAFNIGGAITVNLGAARRIDCIGIGNTDGSTFNINGQNITFNGNGLYMLQTPLNTNRLTISADATFVGRIAAGLAMRIGTSVRKEPSFNSTAEPRTTLSGQVIPGRGGHIFRAVSLDSRYQIDENIMGEIKEGYRYIAMGYPFFISLEEESYKLPFDKLYAIDRNQKNLSFESGARRSLFSRRWFFEERF